MPADGLNGPCVRDLAVPLDDPCADGQVKTVMKSRGYRKVAADVCSSGVGAEFEPYEFTCCVAGGTTAPMNHSGSPGEEDVCAYTYVTGFISLNHEEL